MTDHRGRNSVDHPLVTFALFAYNQEKYIREAIEGAFSQTYEPLEIILSDDCSTDKTYEIMKQMVASYDGSNKIVLRKNEINLGILEHVRRVAKEASGRVMILAAGDDISLPHRVEVIVREWSDGLRAVHSLFYFIDSLGDIVDIKKSIEYEIKNRFNWLKYRGDFVYGASSAYDLEYLRNLPFCNKKILSEDSPLSIMLYLGNCESKLIREKLIKYRIHDESVSNSRAVYGSISNIIRMEMRQRRKFISEVDLMIYIRDRIIPMYPNSLCKIDLRKLDLYIDAIRAKAAWDTLGLGQRLRQVVYSKGRLRKWMMARIMGDFIYAFMKYVYLRARGTGSEWGK